MRSPGLRQVGHGSALPWVMVATFTGTERARAIAWKHATGSLPPGAKHAAPYIDKDGRPGPVAYDFCLPSEFAAWSLLPEVREMAPALFAELGIPWHAGVREGPSNHLLSSQVQCMNALGHMVADPSRVARAFGGLLGTAEVLEIEPGRYLTFEYIGPTDFFNEAPGGVRTRGSKCTSVDAAFLHRTATGVVELVLVEWKYTESYRPRKIQSDKDAERWSRYGSALTAADSPVRSDLLSFSNLLDEPFYQLVRQQLLAHEMEKARVHGAEVVRVVHLRPSGNQDYELSPHRSAQRALGGTTSEVWAQLLRSPGRYTVLDSGVFLDPEITSSEYVSRYGG